MLDSIRTKRKETMTSLEDFDYVLRRLRRDAATPTGEALKMVLVHDKLLAEAMRLTGLPSVRLMPHYLEATRIISGMYVTEADGFTPAEVVVANRALALSRAKEMQYVPTPSELTALGLLGARPGGTALKAMDGRIDELPGAAFKALTALHKAGAVDAQNEGLMLARWTITPLGRQLLQDGVNKR